MYLKRFFVEGLAHASYLLGAKGEAAVVDPKRDVDDYLAAAEREGLRIVAIFNSHPHADFASGFRELARRTGAKVYVSRLAPVKYEHVAAKDGDRVSIGSLEVELLETPGHSPDSLSFLAREDDKPVAILTTVQYPEERSPLPKITETFRSWFSTATIPMPACAAWLVRSARKNARRSASILLRVKTRSRITSVNRSFIRRPSTSTSPSV